MILNRKAAQETLTIALLESLPDNKSIRDALYLPNYGTVEEWEDVAIEMYRKLAPMAYLRFAASRAAACSQSKKEISTAHEARNLALGGYQPASGEKPTNPPRKP